MGYAKKVDDNQREIVEAFRKAGCDVIDLSAVGRGVPDLLVSTKRRMCLVEVKGKRGRLNDRQGAWWLSWLGKPPVIIRSAEEALDLVRRDMEQDAA